MLRHMETHKSHRIGWLRAAVLGANDGIVSTASLILGVAAAQTSKEAILLSGVAGLVAGAMSMAAGEYVSVSSQADTEKADLARETEELQLQPEHELKELQGIYIARGLSKELAHEVALALTAHDALAAHARDELGISEILTARPIQAAWTSAATFAAGALLPIGVAWLAPASMLMAWVGISTLIFLGSLGGIAAHAGGASRAQGAFRVLFWGLFAMGMTALTGRLFGVLTA